MIFASSLFGGEGVGLTALVDYLAHLADAFRALGGAAVADENIARALGARLDGQGHIPLAKAVAVADVHAKPR